MNTLYFELLKMNFKVEAQKAIDIYYQTQLVGKYKADLVVNDLIITKLEAVDHLIEEHEIQLINYLKATDKEVGLLLNFGMKPEICRKAFDNNRKNLRKSLKSTSSACL